MNGTGIIKTAGSGKGKRERLTITQLGRIKGIRLDPMRSGIVIGPGDGTPLFDGQGPGVKGKILDIYRIGSNGRYRCRDSAHIG